MSILDIYNHMDRLQVLWVAGHVVSPVAIGFSWLSLLPAAVTLAATTVALIFYTLEILEMERVKRWFRKRKQRKIWKLRDKLAELEKPEET